VRGERTAAPFGRESALLVDFNMMRHRLADDARDRQRISRRRPSNRCQRERGVLLALKVRNIREIPATRCFTVFPNARRCTKAARKTGNRPSQVRAEVAIKIRDNPQTSPPGSKIDSSEAETVRSVINIGLTEDNIGLTEDIGPNLHRLWASALLAPRLGSSMVALVRRIRRVRRRPLDQWLRALTY
jgi:hypothetical protein